MGIESAKEVMDDLTADLFNGERVIVQISARVFSWYHHAEMVLYEGAKNPSAYYRAGVNYFLYTTLETAKKDYPNLEDVAVRMGLAAMVAPGEYNFGELLELSLFKDEKVKASWIHALIDAFQEGSYELYDKARRNHKAEMDSAPTKFGVFAQKLKDSETLVYEKFCACVLLEYAFRQPKNRRRLQLSRLRELIRVDDVETLLINAMCADLIRGSIDQQADTFTFTWVRARVLDLSRLEILENRIGDWITHQKAVLTRIEEMTPDLLVTV